MNLLELIIQRNSEELQGEIEKLQEVKGLTAIISIGWQIAKMLAKAIIENELACRDDRKRQWPICRRCGKRLENKGKRNRQIISSIGRIEFKRKIGRCPSGCQTYTPLDKELNICRYQRVSLELQKLGCMLAVFLPYQLATILLYQMLSVRFTYTGGKLSAISGPTGRTTFITHDTQGDLTGIVNPDNTTRSFTYDENHLLVSQSNERGFITTYQFDAFGCIVKSNLADGSTREYQPEVHAGLVDEQSGLGTLENPAPAVPVGEAHGVLTDGLGNIRKVQTDALYATVHDEDALGNVTLFQRDSNGMPVITTDARGFVTTATYDDRGNLLTQTNVDLGATWAYEYEPEFNNVTRVTDPLGRVTENFYDERGNLVRVVDALSNESVWTYNAQGRVTSRTDALGRTYTFGHDSLGNMIFRTDPLNNTRIWAYDTAGNRISITDELGRTTSFNFDVMNRRTSITDALGGVTSWEFDEKGNRISQTNANNVTVNHIYDSRDRRVSTVGPQFCCGKNGTETMAYDANGNVSSLTDANGHITYRKYDALNRITQEIRKIWRYCRCD